MDDFNRSFLYRQISFRRWGACREFLKQENTRIFSTYLNYRDPILPNCLSLAVQREAPLDIVASIYEDTGSGYQYMFTEHAIYHGMRDGRENVIDFLISVAPEIVDRQVAGLYFPIDNALYYQRSPRIISKILALTHQNQISARFEPLRRFLVAWESRNSLRSIADYVGPEVDGSLPGPYIVAETIRLINTHQGKSKSSSTLLNFISLIRRYNGLVGASTFRMLKVVFDTEFFHPDMNGNFLLHAFCFSDF